MSNKTKYIADGDSFTTCSYGIVMNKAPNTPTTELAFHNAIVLKHMHERILELERWLIHVGLGLTEEEKNAAASSLVSMCQVNKEGPMSEVMPFCRSADPFKCNEPECPVHGEETS